ncbi:class I adenylate-forming enzyme family protein [Amycolatopsis thermophila]|uniref:Acyl-CoA synthetase (AMP-forming)/AMP-acid ligase II n=1 Tax=Amycolatopsis thermophila TaxID=206084 RepID=A0ABU0F0P1_9PSEU|nr:AMP-binding protein [Amycolatopsis thermophila]MDQ0381135.1 acyl-CoA synthetase (AMP-forming)/AMP-acid ligase II [Amycolatopsis thermophila]
MLSGTTRTGQGTSGDAGVIGPDGLDHRQRVTRVTVADLYERGYHQYGSRVAIRDGSTTITYRELGEQVHRIVGGLGELGVRRGDRGVLLLDNCPEFFEIEHALFVGGFVRTTLSVRLHLREVVHILADCAAAVVFASPGWAEQLAGVRDRLPALRHVVAVAGGPGDTTVDRLREAPPAPYAPPLPHDPAAILYTSGTTGMPKGATLSHANWAAMVRNELLELPPAEDDDRVLHVAPLSHLSGYVAPSYFVRGATHFTCPRFDAVATLELVERHRVTILPMVPTMLNLLVQAAERRTGNYRSLHTVVYAGSPIAPGRLARARQVFGDVFVQFYGLSELPIPIACLSRRDHAFDPAGGVPARLASAGRVSPFVEVRLVDDRGVQVPHGEIGEITVRGDQTMMGYWNLPSATTDMIDAEGWASTGDLGRFDDDGYLYIVDRKKDMVVTGGFNVYPTEVENVVSTLPAVSEVAVVGVPDPVWGEALKAVVVVREGYELSADDVVAVCAANLAGYKKPRSVEFVSELPKTGSGKIMRRQLRDRYWADGDRKVGG